MLEMAGSQSNSSALRDIAGHSLTAAGLETRYAATPSVDSAMSWVLAGE
jgi:hypothetical protein